MIIYVIAFLCVAVGFGLLIYAQAKLKGPSNTITSIVALIILVIGLVFIGYAATLDSRARLQNETNEQLALQLEMDRLYNPDLVSQAAGAQAQSLQDCLNDCPPRGFAEGALFPNVAYRCEESCYSINGLAHPGY